MNLLVGESYLHRNMIFVRTIERIDGKDVYWRDKVGPGRCTKEVFQKLCIGVAPKDERGVEEIKAEQRRQEASNKSKSGAELDLELRCRQAQKEKITHISIEDPRTLGSTYEEVMRCLFVLQEHRLYLRILRPDT